MENKRQPHLSQAGGWIVVICFFLPWLTRDGKEVIGSSFGGIAWLVLLAGLIIVGSVHYFKSAGHLSRAKVIIRLAAVLSLLLLTLTWIVLPSERIGIFPVGMFTTYEIAYGGVGTVLGLLLTLYGSFFLDDIPS